MSPDPRDGRRRAKKGPRLPEPVRTGPSPDHAHEIVYFQRHRDDDPTEAAPGRVALNSYPAKVRSTMRAVLVAVAAAPPKRFAGGGYWEAMKGRVEVMRAARRLGQEVSTQPSIRTQVCRTPHPLSAGWGPRNMSGVRIKLDTAEESALLAERCQRSVGALG